MTWTPNATAWANFWRYVIERCGACRVGKRDRYGAPLLGDVVPEGFVRSTLAARHLRDAQLQYHQDMGRGVIDKNANDYGTGAWAKQPKVKR